MVRIQNGVVTPPQPPRRLGLLPGVVGQPQQQHDMCMHMYMYMYCFPTSPRWWELFCARHGVVIRKCRYMDLAPNYRYTGWPAPQTPNDSRGPTLTTLTKLLAIWGVYT